MWHYDDLSWWTYAVHLSTRGCSATRLLNELGLAERDFPGHEEYSSRLNVALDTLRKGGLTADEAASILFCAKAFKKWRLADKETADQRRIEAVNGFIQRNQGAVDSSLPCALIERMRVVLSDWLPRVEPEEFQYQPNINTGESDRFLITGRFGPGACAEQWSHPRRFERLREWCCSDAHWPECSAHLHDSAKDSCRLCAVPKTATKDRLITIEPAYATFVQQYVRESLLVSIHNGPLRGSAMDLGFQDSQRVQRELALKASRTKSLATLDLKNGSDLISWSLVQATFPPWVLDMLWYSRSTTFIPSDGCPIAQPLHIFAGMGNATTFTVETLFFSALVRAYSYLHRLPGFVSTFGDDVICSSKTASALMEEQFSAFLINQEKSFSGSDALRESCGIFAYQGEDITVARVDGYKKTWEGYLATADLHKRLKSGFSVERRLAFLIARDRLLPNYSFEIDGFPSISDHRVSWSRGPKTRWNPKYQRLEVSVKLREPRTVCYKADDAGYLRYNQPPASTWYFASLAGLLSGGSGRRPEHGPSSFRFPTGGYRWKNRWLPVSNRSLAAPRGATTLSVVSRKPPSAE